MKFEWWKIKKNTFFLIAFVLFTALVSAYACYYGMKSDDFVAAQKQEATIMLQKISASYDTKQADVDKEYALYSRLLHVTTWQEAYHILNEIDQLFIDAPGIAEKNQSDLPYDAQTNIEVRKYYLAHNVHPDEKSGSHFLMTICRVGFDILIPVWLFLICTCVFMTEYETRTVTYLYTLPYSYAHIVLWKWLAACLVSLMLFIPLIVSCIMISMCFGFGNPAVLVESSQSLAQIRIQDVFFLRIPYAVVCLHIVFLLAAFMISAVTCLLSVLCKHSLAMAFACEIIVFAVCFHQNVFITVSKMLTASVSVFLQCLIGTVAVVSALIASVELLRHSDVS